MTINGSTFKWWELSAIWFLIVVIGVVWGFTYLIKAIWRIADGLLTGAALLLCDLFPEHKE